MSAMIMPSIASAEDPSHRHPTVIRVAGSSREVCIELSGDLASSVLARDMLRQLQVVQRRLPTAVEVVHLDLTGLEHITIDVAVLLCVQRRLLAARGIRIGSVVRSRGGATSESVERVLRALIRHSALPDPPRC